MFMALSTSLHGATEIPEQSIAIMRVRHINDHGIQGTYILRNVKGLEDLAARVKAIKDSAPELEWKLHYRPGENVAWIRSKKRIK